MKYFIDNDKTLVLQRKSEMRKALGHSPDYFDALCMANYLAQSREGAPFRAITGRYNRLGKSVAGY